MTTFKTDIHETIVKALISYRGDNLEHAEKAFKNLTPEQMKQQHGISGRTRQEVLDEYCEHHEKIERAIRFINLAYGTKLIR